MIRVFLSYASEDRERVERLYRYLATAGFEPWMDTHDLNPGEEWLKGIQRGIESADCFLACISSRSIQKDGVLGDELRAALERWRKTRGNYRLIPVRLEDINLPASLQKLQWSNLLNDDQWVELADAIRRRTGPPKWLYAAALAVIGIGLAAVIFWYVHRPRWPPGQVRVGVTIWRLRDAKSSDLPGAKMLVHPHSSTTSSKPLELVPERAGLAKPFAVGDRVRVSFESAQQGFLYVIDREQLSDGATGPPKLIFPTLRIRGGRNEMEAGQLAETPAQEDDPPYWELMKLSPQYTGELLTIIFAKQPIEELKPETDARNVNDGWFRAHLKDWEVPLTKTESGSAISATPAEIQAGKQGAKALTHADPLPQTIFSGVPKRGAPLVATFPMRMNP